MNTFLILSIFAIGFLVVWKIRTKKTIKQHEETVEEKPTDIEAVEKPIVETTTIQKRGRKKKVQN